MNSLDWAIGLFEGEGTIVIQKYNVTVSLSSTDQDVVESFCAVVGFGKVYGPYKYGTNKKYFWKWNGDAIDSVIAFLQKAKPLFSVRRSEKAEQALSHLISKRDRPTHYTVSRKGMGGRPTHKK